MVLSELSLLFFTQFGGLKVFIVPHEQVVGCVIRVLLVAELDVGYPQVAARLIDGFQLILKLDLSSDGLFLFLHESASSSSILIIVLRVLVLDGILSQTEMRGPQALPICHLL